MRILFFFYQDFISPAYNALMENEILYHIYNRGAHKELVFQDNSDYFRMLKLLYIANCPDPFKICNLPKDIFLTPRSGTLVDIVAYCLMPNHIHIAVLKKPGHDVSKFMLKLATGYSGYYNLKYDHSGTIWEGPYKHKTAYDTSYVTTLVNYIHLNPYGLKEPQLSKETRRSNVEQAVEYSSNYEFSSFKDYLGIKREQSVILSTYHQGRPR